MKNKKTQNKTQYKFFHFHQNNSGGRFREPAINLVIEAVNVSEAKTIAETEGAYFNGVDDGIDCECCGDRWGLPYDEGTETPQMYGRPIEDFDVMDPFYASSKVPFLKVIRKKD